MSRPELPTKLNQNIPLDTEKPISATLKELLESSRNLPKRSDDIGTIHLGLEEIKRRAYDLRKHNKTEDDVKHFTKAHYLLVNSGVTLEDIQHELDSIDSSPATAAATTSGVASSGSSSINKNNITVNGVSNGNGVNNKSVSTVLTKVNPTALASIDTDTYINKKKDKNILSAIEQSLSTSAKDFDTFVNQNISMDWKQRKNELRESLSIVLKRNVSASATSDQKDKRSKTAGALTPSANPALSSPSSLTWGKKNSFNLISSNFQFKDSKPVKESSKYNLSPDASLAARQKFETYAEVVYQLNDHRQQGIPFQLNTVFAELTKNEVNVKSKQLHEVWLILRDFTDLSNDSNDDFMKSFSKGHSVESLTDFESIKLHKKIINKSRNYLESQFLDFINSRYSLSLSGTNNNTTSAASKNVNNVLITDKIVKYLETTYKRNNEWKLPNLSLINGIPIWAILFYLLRSGCLKEAIELIEKYKDSFQKLERSFPVYLKSYCSSPERKLSNELNARLINEFNQFFKHMNKEIDPFRYAVYKIIGRCDLARKNLPSSITLSIEDWLWVHLSLIREEPDKFLSDDMSFNAASSGAGSDIEPIYERYTLNDLQKTVLQYGAESFNGSNSNPMYLHVLILVGLYENAVQYLFTINEIGSVHLAISLAYYGLLRILKDDTLSNENLLIVDTITGFSKINYVRLIGYYTKNFKISDPRVAIEYLLCICLSGGNEFEDENNNKETVSYDQVKQFQIKVAQEAICDLVLETREFAMTLGKIDRDGLRIPGVIESRKKLLYLKDEESYLKNISERAAIRAEEEGKLYDCILLYQLSEEYDTVLNLINSTLGDYLNSTNIMESIDEKIENDLLRGEVNIVQLSLNFLNSYNNSTKISDKLTSFELIDNLNVLLKIYEIRQDFVNNVNNLSMRQKSFSSILDKIESLNLIPISKNLELDAIRSRANQFNNLNECISKNIPSLLIITMQCINQLVIELDYVNSGNLSSTKESRFESLKKMSRNCMIYSGMLQHKMPTSIFTTLINLESNM